MDTVRRPSSARTEYLPHTSRQDRAASAPTGRLFVVYACTAAGRAGRQRQHGFAQRQVLWPHSRTCARLPD